MSRELRDLGPVQPYRPRHRGATVTAPISSGPPAPRRPVGAVLAAAAAPVPWVAGLTDSPKPPPTRITLTLPVLRAAYSVAFVSGGAAKAPALASILAAGKCADDDDMLPAGRITCAHGPVHWFVDPPAAEQLPPSAL